MAINTTFGPCAWFDCSVSDCLVFRDYNSKVVRLPKCTVHAKEITEDHDAYKNISAQSESDYINLLMKHSNLDDLITSFHEQTDFLRAEIQLRTKFSKNIKPIYSDIGHTAYIKILISRLAFLKDILKESYCKDKPLTLDKVLSEKKIVQLQGREKKLKGELSKALAYGDVLKDQNSLQSKLLWTVVKRLVNVHSQLFQHQRSKQARDTSPSPDISLILEESFCPSPTRFSPFPPSRPFSPTDSPLSHASTDSPSSMVALELSDYLEKRSLLTPSPDHIPSPEGTPPASFRTIKHFDFSTPART